MIYLLGNAPVQAWLKSTDLRRETYGSLVLYLPPSSKRDVLILAMKDIDERLAAAKNFKHGQKTRAAFITLPDGSECFGKSVQIAKMRLENRFRYVVAPTRGLWAAAVAQRLREIGVPTPEVWGAGERRPRLFPTVSYLFTEILRVTQLDVWLRNSDALMDEAERILPRLGRMIGRLHGGRITHNDLKPENVYLSADEEPGLWDLDPAKIHRDPIPLEARAFEFSRIVAGMLAAAAVNPSAADEFFRLDWMLSRLIGKAEPGLDAAVRRSLLSTLKPKYLGAARERFMRLNALDF